MSHTKAMATKKRQAKKTARKAARKTGAAEDGVASARDVFARFLRKADPKEDK